MYGSNGTENHGGHYYSMKIEKRTGLLSWLWELHRPFEQLEISVKDLKWTSLSCEITIAEVGSEVVVSTRPVQDCVLQQLGLGESLAPCRADN